MGKRNVLARTLGLLVLVACVIGLSSCGKKCVHEWDEWDVTTEATCVEDGKQTRTCLKCGAVNESVIAKTPCDWSAATCTSPRKCKNCFATDGVANGHFYTKEIVVDKALVTPANCSNSAVYYKSCDCGAISKTDTFRYIAGGLGDHSFVGATCTAPQSCKFCDLTIGEALGHEWAAATCTRPATCSKCRDTKGEALGHKFVGGTCVEAKVCSVCSAKATSVPGHNYGAPTCTYDEACLSCGLIHGENLEHKVNSADTCVCVYCSQDVVHVFDEKVEAPEYLVVGKTDEYYYSCECGAKGTETFVVTTTTP